MHINAIQNFGTICFKGQSTSSGATDEVQFDKHQDNEKALNDVMKAKASMGEAEVFMAKNKSASAEEELGNLLNLITDEEFAGTAVTSIPKDVKLTMDVTNGTISRFDDMGANVSKTSINDNGIKTLEYDKDGMVSFVREFTMTSEKSPLPYGAALRVLYDNKKEGIITSIYFKNREKIAVEQSEAKNNIVNGAPIHLCLQNDAHTYKYLTTFHYDKSGTVCDVVEKRIYDNGAYDVLTDGTWEGSHSIDHYSDMGALKDRSRVTLLKTHVASGEAEGNQHNPGEIQKKYQVEKLTTDNTVYDKHVSFEFIQPSV